MLNPNAAGLDLHKEEIWVCPGGFQDNYEPEVKTFGTLTGELRKLVAYLKEKKVTAVAMEATGIYWIPVFEMLKNEGFDTCLAFHGLVCCLPYGRRRSQLETVD